MRFSFAVGLFWMSVACCAVAQVYIIRSVQQGRRRTEVPVVASRSGHGVELLWVVLPALALIVLLSFTWRAVRSHEQTGQPPRALASGV